MEEEEEDGDGVVDNNGGNGKGDLEKTQGSSGLGSSFSSINNMSLNSHNMMVLKPGIKTKPSLLSLQNPTGAPHTIHPAPSIDRIVNKKKSRPLPSSISGAHQHHLTLTRKLLGGLSHHQKNSSADSRRPGGFPGGTTTSYEGHGGLESGGSGIQGRVSDPKRDIHIIHES